MNTIERVTVSITKTVTADEITITYPGQMEDIEVEVTTPDQDAVFVDRGVAIVYVASTTGEGIYDVRFKGSRLMSCSCAACARSPRKWAEDGCIHARAAEVTLAHRKPMALARGGQLAGLLKKCGWTAPKFRSEVRRYMRIVGGDAWEGLRLMEAKVAPGFTFKLAA